MVVARLAMLAFAIEALAAPVALDWDTKIGIPIA
jgi:hypothetical protein